MKTFTSKLLMCLVLISIAFTAISFNYDDLIGWFKAGSKPKSYDMSIDKGAGQNGTNVATIKSIEKKIDGFGTLMQVFKPDKYKGHKIRMTGFVKSENVKAWSGLWLRVDQLESKTPLSFDNMRDRPIKGDTEWKKYEIVLEVPENASKIAFGALLSGTGQIWFDSIEFEIANDTIPTTNYIKNKPANLDFEK